MKGKRGEIGRYITLRSGRVIFIPRGRRSKWADVREEVLTHGVAGVDNLKMAYKKERRRVNEDRPGASYEKMRAYGRKIAQTLLPKEGKPRFMTDRSTLEVLDKRDFPEGTVIGVGKYRITISGSRRQDTAVFTTTDLRDLRRNQMPFYIRRFVYTI